MSRNRYRADRRASRRGLYAGRDWIAAHPDLRGASSDSGSGLTVDRFGGPAVDPTRNVIALNDASIRRIDDMQELYARLQDEKIRRMEREAILAAQMVALRADHQHALDTLEAKRLDAVRSVDQLAVKTEADRSAAAITALATTAATTAETLRNAVNTSATNLATQLTNTVNAITERIAALEKSSYEGKGKQAVADPMMAELVVEMRSLTSSRAVGDGKAAGFGASWAILIGAVGLIGTLLAIGGVVVSIVLFTMRSSAANSPIYVPAPPGTVLPSTPPQNPPR